MHKYRKLRVYHKAIKVITDLYKFTNELPEHEKFGLISQIRRAAVSISLNIAEGSGAGSDKDFVNFLRISLKSVYELLSALEICYKLGYCSKMRTAKVYNQVDEIGAMLSTLIKKLSLTSFQSSGKN